MEERSTLNGTVLSLIFHNQENGYAVLRLSTEDGDTVTVVGCIPYAAPGEELLLTGVWVEHPQHGRQFSAEEVERRMPSTEAEILNYLASGVIHGVGPATAQRMVERFGEDTFFILEQEPQRLKEIKGITARRAQEIAENFRTQTGMRRLMEFLGHYQLPMLLSIPLYRRFGAEAAERLRENPYLLCAEDCGVDFSVTDEIALSLGFSCDSEQRMEAAVLFELQHNERNGHVFLPREKLCAASAQLVEMSEDGAEKALDTLIERGSVVASFAAGVDACYLRRLYAAEMYVCARLNVMLTDAADRGRDASRIIGEIEREQGIQYAPLQRQAVELAAQEGVLLLTGGPGTGKTTSVRAIVALLERMGLDVVLAAPTGRAAMRMGEVCAQEAQTIHRLLGMSFNDATGEVTFAKCEKEPLEADALIVDEMSMVDLELMAALLAALRPGCRLVLVGDPDQLPSVGAGNVFRDLLRSERIPTVRLSDVFRQAEQSAIIRNAHAVNAGAAPNLKNSGEGDFFFLPRRDSVRLVETVVELCKTRLPEKMGIEAGQIQVITPTHKGGAGTAALNRALQFALNPPDPTKRERAWGDIIFREGDRVMQNRNDYDVLWVREDGTEGSGVFNGDVGRIVSIDPSLELLQIDFDGRVADYTSDMLAQLDIAYAITVHKAQGSEYRAVVFAAAPCAPSLMVRGVLYTALTRARELLIMVGDDAAVTKMVENDRQQRRYSGLRWRLKNTADT